MQPQNPGYESDRESLFQSTLLSGCSLLSTMRNVIKKVLYMLNRANRHLTNSLCQQIILLYLFKIFICVNNSATSYITVMYQEFVSRAEGSYTNLTCVTSWPGDGDVTAVTTDVSHVALQTLSKHFLESLTRKRELPEKHVSDHDRQQV